MEGAICAYGFRLWLTWCLHLCCIQGEAISEDSHFTVTLRWPHIWGSQATYLGVADGVGSWREHKVDPAAFSQALMKSARQHIEARATRAIDGELVRSALIPFPFWPVLCGLTTLLTQYSHPATPPSNHYDSLCGYMSLYLVSLYPLPCH